VTSDNGPRYAMAGLKSGELLTYQLAILWHDNPRELEYLFPNVRVVPLTRDSAAGRRVMNIKKHPDLSHVRWPLDPADFVRPGR
jgi:hypothetical protein